MPRERRRDRQAVRLLSIFLLLLQGSRLTVHELAARFKTRRETIYRDLRTLGDVGIPIEGDESGRLSRPRLAADYRLRFAPVPLTRHEIAALTWAVKESRTRQPFQAALSTALPKLQTFASPRDGRLAVAFDGAVAGWDRGVKDYEAAGPTVLRLLEAIVNNRRCKLEYAAPGQSRPRRFPYDPYRLLVVHGGLYCVGKVPAYANFVTVAVDRIGTLEVTEEPFTADPAFDPKRHEAEAFGVTWEKPVTIMVRFSADQAPYVRERQWHPTQKLHELRDGRVELTFRAGGMFEIMRWVLSWGGSAEVVRPAALRREVESAIQEAATVYERQMTAPRDQARGERRHPSDRRNRRARRELCEQTRGRHSGR
jgi:predicted DNA-binding transcriptional regulator YafY